MALEIIPNQPVLFRPAGWREPCPCDDCPDCMMIANGDDLYAQVKMTPCGDELICGQITLGPELVINGTFTGSAAGWTLGPNWAYNSNAIRSTGSTIGETASQSIASLIVGRTYRVTYTVLNYVSGDVTVVLGATSGATQTANGTYTEDITVASGTTLLFSRVSINFSGDIDDVSVKELHPCWTTVDVDPEAEYTITDDMVCVNGTLTFVSTVSGAVTGGAVRYVLSFTISNYVSGNVDLQFGSGNTIEGDFSGNGEKFAFDFFITDTNIAFVFDNFIGCISDISIKLLQPPVFYAVNENTGEIINLGTSLLTFFEDRIIFKLPMDGEAVLSYGCWRLCLINRCGITGDELLTNGTFTDDLTGWLAGGGWGWDNNTAHFIDTGVSGILQQILEEEANMCVSVEVSTVTEGGELRFNLVHGGDTVASQIITEPGVYVLCGLATRVQFVGAGGNGQQYVIDNVSAFEIEDCAECAAWCSNCIKYAEEFESCVLLLQSHENTNSAWGFVWNDAVGTNIFKLSHRIQSKLWHPAYPEESNDYTFSDGKTEDTFAQSDKFWTLGIDPESERAHDVIRLQKRSKHFVITDINESREFWAEKGDYNPDWPDGGCRAPANIKVKLKTSTLFNNLCTE